MSRLTERQMSRSEVMSRNYRWVAVDLCWAMSALLSVLSASPLRAEQINGAAKGSKVTQPRHWAD
jgi:hypothetical protein